MAIKVEASGKEVLDLVDRVGKGLEWLGSKQMYIWRTEYTIEKLRKARNELEDMINMAVETMEDAKRNGWSLKGLATGWVREGLVFIGYADGVIMRFKEQVGDPSSIFHCPCETLSRRSLNARAIMRLNDILEHKVSGNVYATGSFEDVAFNRGTTAAGDLQTPSSLHDRLAALIASRISKTTPVLTSKLIPAAKSSDGAEAVAVPVSCEANCKQEAEAASHVERIRLSSFTQYRAFARSQSYASVPVLIQVNAPKYVQRFRTPIDLVLVLDVSGSMRCDDNLDQLKLGAMFVVHNMEVNDRLSIVKFSTHASLLFPLTNMSKEAKSKINPLITNLAPGGHTNMEAAMLLANKILHDRADEDRVGSIIFFTDGMQTHGDVEHVISGEKYTTYTIGMGTEQDTRTLYSMAISGHGTYSFVSSKNPQSIRDAMAVYIGGLTSIVAQDLEICISSAHREVRIADIMCGGYKHSVVERGKLGAITVNDLCGGEVKNFIVYVNIPEEETFIFGGTPRTSLLTVTANYYCPLTMADVRTDTIEVSVERPGRVRGQDCNIVIEVASEVTRANVFKGVEGIWCQGQLSKDIQLHEYVNRKLNNLRDSINGTEEAKSAKDRWEDLISDLDNMQNGMHGETDVKKWENNSLPYMLSWLTSHQWQRAATRGYTFKSRWFNFRTTRMQNMIDSVESAPSAFI